MRADSFPRLLVSDHRHILLQTMFEPIRGGTRGGQAEFKWSDVSADKDREVRTYIVFRTLN